MNDESSLVQALLTRDQEAFQQVFDTYADRLFRVAMGVVGDETEAECVVQDSFIKLIENLDRFEGRSRLGTWLYRVAYNLSIDRLRKQRPQQPLSDEADFDEASPFMPVILVDWSHTPESVLSSDEAEEELTTAITSLPENLRTVFILREIEGLSTTETADILEISEGAVKVRLHRARLQLREKLSSYFQERRPKEER